MSKYAAQDRYNATHTVMLRVRLNRATDADIIAHLEQVDNRMEYVRSLIRADMQKEEQ